MSVSPSYWAKKLVCIEAFFWSYYMIWLLWQPVDPLFRAPGDEEAQEENLIVSKGKMHILTFCQPLSPLAHPWHTSIIEFPFGSAHSMGKGGISGYIIWYNWLEGWCLIKKNVLTVPNKVLKVGEAITLTTVLIYTVLSNQSEDAVTSLNAPAT